MKDLILFSAEVPSVSLSKEALELREQALDLAATVLAVADVEQQERAVEVQAELKRVSKLFEDSRVQATAPLLEAQRSLKALVDKEKFAIQSELNRIGKLNADFQTLLDAKRRAAEAAQKADLEKAEKERQEALAKAKSHEQLDKINEDYCRKQAAITAIPLPEVQRAVGQVVKDEWVVDGINDWTLIKKRPDLVRKIEWDLVAIKKDLASSEAVLERERESYIKERLPGVTAHIEKKSSVRANAQPRVIEV